ncbi:MAG: TauD/TfdA family dioxygenase, partial [Gammaproteobacteria bacterium]
SAGMLRKGYSEVTDPSETPGARHPMVWTDTGGKQALFLGRRPHAYVVGLSADDSNQLLDEVWSHATNSEWTWHNEWEVGDLIMWQNHLVMHRRDAFDGNTRRIMHRTQLKTFAA